MTRRTPFTHLQLPDPQITTTAVLRGGCDLAYGLMLASLPCLGCLAWIHDQAPSLPPESRSWGCGCLSTLMDTKRHLPTSGPTNQRQEISQPGPLQQALLPHRGVGHQGARGPCGGFGSWLILSRQADKPFWAPFSSFVTRLWRQSQHPLPSGQNPIHQVSFLPATPLALISFETQDPVG